MSNRKLEADERANIAELELACWHQALEEYGFDADCDAYKKIVDRVAQLIVTKPHPKPSAGDEAKDAERLDWLVKHRRALVPIEGGGWDVYAYARESNDEYLVASHSDYRAAIDAAISNASESTAAAGCALTDTPAQHGFTCAAGKDHSQHGKSECDWPVCGCDPKASKVIENLEDRGLLMTAQQGTQVTKGERQFARCCGREECGGECGNEWQGMTTASEERARTAELADPTPPAPEEHGSSADVRLSEELAANQQKTESQRYTIDGMADRFGKFTPEQALDLAKAFWRLSKANGHERELPTDRLTPEAALIDAALAQIDERRETAELMTCKWVAEKADHSEQRRRAEAWERAIAEVREDQAITLSALGYLKRLESRARKLLAANAGIERQPQP